MPFAENRGVKIYYEVHGHGQAVVLLHGFTNSLQIWKVAGYVAALEKSHQVILIDQRGHGRSDKPHEPDDYSLDKRMEDVIRVMDCAGCGQAGLLGYSMGGWLAFALALNYPERFVSLAAGGAHPYQEDLNEFSAVDGSDPDAFIASLSAFLGEEIAPHLHKFILQNDLRALASTARKRASFEERLSELVLPCLLFAGEKDRRLALVKACAETLPAAKMFVVPAAGHVTALLEADVILPKITKFLQKQRSPEKVGGRFKIFAWFRVCLSGALR